MLNRQHAVAYFILPIISDHESMLYCNFQTLNQEVVMSKCHSKSHPCRRQKFFTGETSTGTSQKIEYGEKMHFFLVTFQKVKLSYILDSLHVKTLQK